MSKIRPSAKAAADALLMESINGSAAMYGVPSDDQALVAGVSRATWYRRLQHPGEFTLDEFRSMCRRYHWTEEQVLKMVRI